MRSGLFSFKYLRDRIWGLMSYKETEGQEQGNSVGNTGTQNTVKSNFELRTKGLRNTAGDKENWAKVRGKTGMAKGVRVYNSIEWAELELSKQLSEGEGKRRPMRVQQETSMGVKGCWRSQESKARYQKFLQGLADSNAEAQGKLTVELPTQAIELSTQGIGVEEYCPVPVLRKLYKVRRHRE